MKTLMTAGKGGTGKTTILFDLLTRHFLAGEDEAHPGPILVVDADPHQCLTDLLVRAYDVSPSPPLGGLRRDHELQLRFGADLENASRSEFAELLARQALTVLPRAHLLSMGFNQRQGCQCIVNNLLARALDALANRYSLVIVDNEAGIEPMGRHGWDVDALLLTATPRMADIEVAKRILNHAAGTGRFIRRKILALNFIPPSSGDLPTLPLEFAAMQTVSLPIQNGHEGLWGAKIQTLFEAAASALRATSSVEGP